MSSGPFAEESRGTYRTIPTDDEQTLAHNVEDPAAPSQAESRQASSSRLQRLRPNALGLTEDPPHPSVLPPTPLPAQFPETDRQQNVEMLGVDDGSPAPVGSAQTQVSVLPNPSEKSPTHSSAIPSSRKASSGARPDPNMQNIDPMDGALRGDTAVWKAYVEEAGKSDKSLIENWNSNMDSILIFAGLFSGILTAFIIEFYRLLKVEQDDLATKVLIDMNILLRHSLSNSTDPIPAPLSNFVNDEYNFESSYSVIWLNALWFSSLALSLGTAITAQMVKQWLQFYDYNLHSGNTHVDALRRQHRFGALHRWKVPTIVSVLPLMMHTSVALFLAGLVVALWMINFTTAIVVLCLSSALLILYVGALLMPLYDASCSYKSTALVLLQDLLHRTHVTFWRLAHQLCCVVLLRANLFSLPIFRTRNREKAEPPPWNRLQGLLTVLAVEFRHFIQSPVRFTDVHHIAARDHRRNNLEQIQVEAASADLDIEAVFWLIKESGNQDLVDLGLRCLSQLKPQPQLTKKCLLGNVQSLLIRKANIPLPSRDHDTWKKLLIATPEHCLRDPSSFSGIGQYLQSLMFIWHHPDYFSTERPSIISDSQRWYLPDDQEHPVLRTDRHSSGDHDSMSEPPVRLLGDWLRLWRGLKVATGGVLQTLLFRGWDLDAFALIVCTEAHYYTFQHGTLGSVALNTGKEDDSSPYSDLYGLIRDYSSNLDISDETLAQIIDSYTFVMSKAPADHILFGEASLLAILRLLSSRTHIYDDVLHKLVGCLSMFQLSDWDRQEAVSVYWQTNGALKYDRETLYQRLSAVLNRLHGAHISAIETGTNNAGLSPTIANLCQYLLLESALEQDVPLMTYNNTFIRLSQSHASLLLTKFADSSRLSEWRSSNTLLWFIMLLYTWYDSEEANLGPIQQEQIMLIFYQLLRLSWREAEVQLICPKILPFWASKLVGDPEMGKVTAKYACLTLRAMFHTLEDQREGKAFLLGEAIHGGKALLFEYEKYGLWGKLFAFLKSEACKAEVRREWAKLRKLWSEETEKSGWINPREETLFGGLYGVVPPGGTPHTGSGVLGSSHSDASGSSSQIAERKTVQPILLKKRLDLNTGSTLDLALTEPYSPPQTATDSRRPTFQTIA